MTTLIEEKLYLHHRYKQVTLLELLGKIALIRLNNGNIIGVQARLLKPIKP